MSTKLTYTGAEVQELLDKIEKGDFDNAKTLEGRPASYFAIASEFTSLAESFATEQGRISALYSYFNNGSANDALRLGGQLPSYYATATQYEILQRTLSDFKSLFDSMFEKDADGNIHAKLSLWSSGGITAGGVGSGGSGGGGGISYNRLDSWADYSADKAGYVLSALLGKDLDSRVSALANAGYITASYLAPYALRSEIPSLVGYATQSWVGENYLSRGGGKLVYSGAQGLEAERTDGAPTHIMFLGLVNGTSRQLGGFGMNGYNDPVYVNPNGIRHKVLTAENYSDYALPITGGTINSNKYVPLSIRNTNLSEVWVSFEDSVGTSYIGSSHGVPTIYLGTGSNNTILHSGNYADYALSKYGGTVNGSITANSFIGNLTGTADKSKVLGDYYGERVASANLDFTDSAVRKIIATSSMTTARPPADGSILHFAWDNTGGWNHQLFIACGAETGPDKRMAWRAQHYGSWSEWKSIAFIDSNVASATKLATPRTIWGQSFDGTQDITGALTSSSIIKASSFFSTSISIECGANGVVDPITYGGEINRFSSNLYLQNRGGNIYLSHASGTTYIRGKLNGVGATFTDTLTVPSITIGGATLTYDSVNDALCINGNMYALGGITAGGAGISAYTSLEARVARLEQQLNIS